jgi:hypothetical protein
VRRPMTGRCSPRSCTCSPADVRGGTCRPRSGSRFLLRTEGLPRGWQPGCSKNCIVRCSTNSVVRANSTGRQQSWTRQASGQKGGFADRPQSRRPRQEGIEDPRPVRNKRNPTGRGRDRGEHSRQHDAATNGGRASGNEVQARTTPTQAGKASRRQGLRLRHAPTVTARTRHRPEDRPPRHRAKRPPRPVPVEDRTHHCLAHRLPTYDHPLRTPRRTLRRLPSPRRRTHLLQETPHMRHALNAKPDRSGHSAVAVSGRASASATARLRIISRIRCANCVAPEASKEAGRLNAPPDRRW